MMLLMADSANCYSSALSGRPSDDRKSVRITLSYIRDIGELASLTFIDVDYNISDSPTKTVGGIRALLLSFLKYGFFKIGFICR